MMPSAMRAIPPSVSVAAGPSTGVGRFIHPRSSFVAVYRRTHAEGGLRPKVEAGMAALERCLLCPRGCGADRAAGQIGVCRTGRQAIVSSAFPHLGEEDCLRGWRGSGTIFFSQCNLRCVFCQNYELSHLGEGHAVSAPQLAGLMLRLQEAGCHNLNLVTPSHVVPQILEALLLAVDRGFALPLVYNTSGYDRVETLRMLEGVVDIYMPDFKFWNPDAAARFLQARDYPVVARQALREMHRQVGALKLDERGLALRGVLVRHLVIPGHVDDTREIMKFLAAELSRDTFVNLMDQYRPAWQAARQPRFAAINRSLEAREFPQAASFARDAGLWRVDQRGRLPAEAAD